MQTPENIRKFDDDFKDRYDSNKYNYEGTDVVTQTKTGSGKYEDYKKGNVKQKERNNSDSFSIN
ncbi:hypothetical protein, partial [Algibacter sp.]|uniref:hypothetical protein n=1 Tax=Algibacter sp. TaxID=1872428 RepID=UPI003C72A26E